MQDESSPIFKIMSTFSFLMLLFITVSQEPIQKAVDTLARDYEKEGRKLLCERIKLRDELLATQIENGFIKGCVASTIDYNIHIRTIAYPDKSWEQIRDELKADEITMDKIEDSCANRMNVTAVQSLSKVVMFSYEEDFDCWEF